MSIKNNLISSAEYEEFLLFHKAQLETSGVPSYLWETLCQKLHDTVLDAGSYFGIAQVAYEEEEKKPEDPLWAVVVTHPEGISKSDPTSIFLVDHAWTFRPEQAKTQLLTIPGLLERMAALMDIDTSVTEREQVLSSVLNVMWKYTQTYSIGSPGLEAEEKVPVWYILDEFGSKIPHSDAPNFRIVPFYYLPEQAAYSLLFPIEDLDEGDLVTRNYVEGPYDNLTRQALLLPWKPAALDVSFQVIEPTVDYFMSSRQNETLPNLNQEFPGLPADRPIKVYVEYKFIRQFLKSPRFEIVDSDEEADILWYSKHYKQFKQLSEDMPQKRVNQFPCEHVLTVKDLLCLMGRRKAHGEYINPDTLESRPSWLPTTFNMKTELPQFVTYYQARDKKGLDNYWIVKPWNLARSLDTHISNNRDFLLRLPTTGPKVVQKYITRPILFERPDIGRVKFDIRYILLLKSVQPLEVYAYQRFWLRFANKPFELDHFEEYERHFTVMNYTENTTLHQMFCHDFITQFDNQYPDFPWKTEVEPKIFEMLKGIFEGAVGAPPPAGLGHNPQSRAMYAADLMLEWTEDERIQPKLLEVNWAPDCKRACDYYPEFFDDVFSVLFLEETEGKHAHLL